MTFFCLNIDSATERRAHCAEQFAKASIDVQFVSALDTRMNHLRHTDPSYRIGQLGCYLSHLRLMEEVRRYDYSPAVIMEDDISLCDDFRTRLDAAMLTLPEDWEVAFIGWWPEYHDHTRITTEAVNADWMRATGGALWGTHCYMINGRKGAERLMQIMQPITAHVDDHLYAQMMQGKIKGYLITEPLADQSQRFPSQTQS